jgi:UDP-glucose 4-epimerase
VIAIFSELMLQKKRPTIFGDGTKTRDYVYVNDIIAANTLVMDDTGNGEIYNLGWGKEISDMDVFLAVKRALASDIEPLFSQKRPGEIERISLDSSKAKKELRWMPMTDFEKGVELATKYYKNKICEKI